MPKPVKRGDSYRIAFMFNRERYAATFDTEKQCKTWYEKKLAELKLGINEVTKRTPGFTEIAEKYIAVKLVDKKSGKDTEARIRAFIRDYPAITGRELHQITPQILTNWRDDRLKVVQSPTVKRDISALSPVFTYAVKELFLIDRNPFEFVLKPRSNPPRETRIGQDVVQSLLDELNYVSGQIPATSKQRAAYAFLIALQTGLRRKELLELKKVNFFGTHLKVVDSKTDSGIRAVPVDEDTEKLINLLASSHEGETVAGIGEHCFKSVFRRAREKTGLKDIWFRDSRHEASYNIVNRQGINILDAAAIIGHSDVKMLQKVYYNAQTDELVNKFRR